MISEPECGGRPAGAMGWLSPIRRFAGGIGGQVATILLAAFTLGQPGPPRFAAFTRSFLIAAGLCVAGTACLFPGTKRS